MNKFKEMAFISLFPFMKEEILENYFLSLEITQINDDNLETYLSKYAYWEDDSHGCSLEGCAMKGFDREGKLIFDERPNSEEEPLGLDEILLSSKSLDSVRFIFITEFEIGKGGNEGTFLILSDEIRAKIMIYLSCQLEQELQEISKELDS